MNSLQIGTRVIIKDSYKPYRSMRGLKGTVIWINKPGNLFQIQTDTLSPYTKKDFCFVQIEDIDIIEPIPAGERI